MPVRYLCCIYSDFYEVDQISNSQSVMGTINPICTTESTLPPSSLHDFPSLSDSGLYPFRLSQFGGTLTLDECFYALNTLLQQYYVLYQKWGKVMVSAQRCRVSRLGQIRIDQGMPETMGTHSWVDAIAQIIQRTTRLGHRGQRQSFQQKYLLNKVSQLVYQYHREEKTLQTLLMAEISLLMQTKQIKCNLVPAIIRLQVPSTHYDPYSPSSNFMAAEEQPFEKPKTFIFGNLQRSKSLSILQRQPHYSRLTEQEICSPQKLTKAFSKYKDNQSTKVDSQLGHNCFSGLRVVPQSKRGSYRHKMVRTEGQNYFNHIHQHLQHRQRDSYLSELPPTERPQQVRQYMHTSPVSSVKSPPWSPKQISSQFSINILNALPKMHRQKVSCKTGQVKFKQQVSSGNDSGGESSKQNILKRHSKKNTSLHAIEEVNATNSSRIYTKSVLNELARSIEALEEPSSKSHIF